MVVNGKWTHNELGDHRKEQSLLESEHAMAYLFYLNADSVGIAGLPRAAENLRSMDSQPIKVAGICPPSEVEHWNHSYCVTSGAPRPI